jgi:hypothetical protein
MAKRHRILIALIARNDQNPIKPQPPAHLRPADGEPADFSAH